MGGFSGDLCLGRGESGGRPKPPPVGEVPSVARRKGRRGASAAFGRRVPLPAAAKGPKRRRGWAPVDRGPQGPHPRTPVLRGTHYLGPWGSSGARDQAGRQTAFRATGPWPVKICGFFLAPTAPGRPNTGSR